MAIHEGDPGSSTAAAADRNAPTPLIFGIDARPPWPTTLALGFQHYLTMFGSTVAIPLILSEPLGIADDPVRVAQLIGTMFFVSGLTTLLQTTFGNRLPIVQGGTFSFLTPTITICSMAALASAGFETRMHHIQLAIIAGGVVEMVVGYSGVVSRLLKWIGPVTIAPTIALIGLALFQFGAPIAGTDWRIGGLTLILIVLFSQYLRRVHRVFELFPILLAILIAWGVAAVATWLGAFGPGDPGYVSGAGIEAAPWIAVPRPFQWGLPRVEMSSFMAAFAGMLAGYVASIVESIGDYHACARLAGAPVPDQRTVSRGIGTEGLGCVVAGIFGTGNGTTSYSENIGAIGLTRVGARVVVQAGAVLMVVLGMIGKFGAIFTSIPQPIVGGMYCAMFGMIAAVGLSNLQFVNLNSPRNLFIIGFALFMGLSVPQYFALNPLAATEIDWLSGVEPGYVQWALDIVNILGGTSMAVGALIALVLDNTIPGTDHERGLTSWRGR